MAAEAEVKSTASVDPARYAPSEIMISLSLSLSHLAHWMCHSFLAPEDIPIKLRCAICNRLAVNAFRLPCCDQSICETCKSTIHAALPSRYPISAASALRYCSDMCELGHSRLPQQCPVCEHSPLSAEDCKPNKSLRTTIKVFLRTEEKKREQARDKQRQDQPSVASSAPVPPPEQKEPVRTVAPTERKASVDSVVVGEVEKPVERKTLEAAASDGSLLPQKSAQSEQPGGQAKEVCARTPHHHDNS